MGKRYTYEEASVIWDELVKKHAKILKKELEEIDSKRVKQQQYV